MTTDATREHCVDAETLAAWADRGLPAADAAAVELHLSNCERCQDVLAAFVRSQPQAAVVLPFWSRPAVRLGAAGLAVAASVTLVVWTNRPPSVPPPTSTVASSDMSPEAPPATASAPPRRAEARPRPTLPPSVTATQAPPPPPVSVTAAAPTVGGIAQQTAAPTRPTAVLMDAMAERASPDVATVEIIAPDPLASAARMAAGGGVPVPARWRILGGTGVQRSVDGGITWTVADVPSTQPFVLTAGSASSQNVCWLVGRDGAVFLSRNGLTFERIAFPQKVHLRFVQAIDALRAVVTTEDGRTFSTSDGGLTWVVG